ncbi:MAG: glycoside hydrolase family 3 protein [Oliverpabstia sp.]
MANYTLDMEKYKQLARQASAEGCVLLKNEKETLPIRDNQVVSVFGRIAFHYYKSGTGSGGLVNTSYVTGILDGLRTCETIRLNEELIEIYESWISEHPFDKGKGWGQEPWSQREMPLEDSVMAKAASSSDMALVVIGRTAGEDQDAKNEPGSYLLTDDENAMLEKVCKAFNKVAVVLNVGNIIDMKWVEKYQPQAVMYVWQGGQEGGNGVADVLTGKVNPCGKLTDTIARNIEDYPSTKNFGDAKVNLYQEDIYVGYRYFETFAPEKVLYPFGYGCSYTTFSLRVSSFVQEDDMVKLAVAVKNTGNFAGKEVVQVYSSAPQGLLGKPVRELKAYEKTKELEPGEEEILEITLNMAELASYDDEGKTGNKSCYVLEKGDYKIYVGTDVRNAENAGTICIGETTVVEKLTEALAPVTAFERLRPVADTGKEGIECGIYNEGYEKVPLRTIAPQQKIDKARENQKPYTYTGDCGYKLADVYDGKIDMDTFISQLSDEDLMCIVRGEGMCSPKVTAGTAAAFGGVTDRLQAFGIPVGCCADGPSGIRMDCGTIAFSLPNGTSLGCTFNKKLVEELYTMTGMELRKNHVDTLLGPGINIHRNPLNGRNFEYISEDPYMTGTMAAAQIRGMGHAGVTGTIKHFAGNNQEFHRHDVDSVVSERALREIYLKGFEMAVKDGGAYSVMTTYGAVNGIWTAGSYDLVTTILREEWGFQGIAMTDWWAKINEDGGEASMQNTGIMVRAQNDLFMVVQCPEKNSNRDNSAAALKKGIVTRGEFGRCAANICQVLMRSPVMDRFLGRTPEDDMEIIGDTSENTGIADTVTYHEIGDDTVLDMSDICTDMGHSEVFGISAESFGMYELSADMSAEAGELAQLSVSVFFDNQLKGTFVINGTNGKIVTQTMDLGMIFGANHYIKLHFSINGMKLHRIRFRKTEAVESPF